MYHIRLNFVVLLLFNFLATILVRNNSVLSVSIQQRTKLNSLQIYSGQLFFLSPFYDGIYNDLLQPISMYIYFFSNLLNKVGKHSEFQFSFATSV